MQRIAVTGGVAEGKTTVLRMFESLGATTLSSDRIAATLLLPGTDLWRELIQEFGQAILEADGALARERLAQLAFSDARFRRRLNRLMHPPVVHALETQVNRLEPGSPLVLIEVPLLIETALQGWFDSVIVVQATPALQRRRLLERGVPMARARQMMRAQLPTRCKVAFADWVIRTHRPLQQVEQQVRRIWRALTESRGVY
ncbi:MAG: dephospho-CoA kinase [Fimbriimonadales bacterium]|nr:dephospho-CoA kinase [Fimbriimonadales bacterium]